MTVESAADRLAFLNGEEFGTAATYLPAAGGALALAGIFDRPHRHVVLGEAAVSMREPTYLCRADDLPAGYETGEDRGQLTVDGTTYTIVDVRPDGTGMVLLVLGDPV